MKKRSQKGRRPVTRRFVSLFSSSLFSCFSGWQMFFFWSICSHPTSSAPSLEVEQVLFNLLEKGKRQTYYSLFKVSLLLVKSMWPGDFLERERRMSKCVCKGWLTIPILFFFSSLFQSSLGHWTHLTSPLIFFSQFAFSSCAAGETQSHLKANLKKKLTHQSWPS